MSKQCKTCNKTLWGGNKTGFCVPCLGLQRSGSNNSFHGKVHSMETKQKMSGPRPSVVGEKNPRFNRPHSQETKDLISKKAKQRLQDRPELLDQLKQNGVKSSLTSYRITKPQRSVQAYLDERSIRYKQNGLLDRFSYDFILLDSRCIIEVQGTYWHADPRVYGEGKTELTDRQKFKIAQDILKKEVAETYGYTMYYIWEAEIKNKDFSSIESICQIL